MADSVEISLSDLTRLVDQTLCVLGLTEFEREVVSDVLLYAQLRGRSQGLIKIIEKTVQPGPGERAPIKIHQRTPCLAHVEGNGNLGMVVLRAAADCVIESCTTQGMAFAGTCGTGTSTGSIGYYAERVARAGFISIVMAGSPKVMALHGSSSRSMGTNPMAFAIPTGNDPLVFDMATSGITWFDIIQLAQEGGELPPGVALDSEGNSTLSPTAALEGVLTTFAGYKGSGLALMVECMTGPLVGASILGEEDGNRGAMVMAIDPDAVLGNNGFTERMDVMLERMRSGEAVEGGAGVRFPGEGSRARARECIESGVVLVNRELLKGLEGMVD